jgi:hypothetical protein
MIELQIYRSMPAIWTLQAVQRVSGNPPTNLLASDVPSAGVWTGQDQAVIFAPTATWTDTAGNGTNLGWQTGQVDVQVTAANSGALDANGIYLLLVSVTRSGVTWPIWEGRLKCLPTAGAAANTITPYCAYRDMLDYGPWVEAIQSLDTDQEGFYSQRLKSRNWMDWCILNMYRGQYMGQYGMHSVIGMSFGWVGYKRQIGPSPSMIQYLAQNKLIVRPQIVEACSHKALAEVGLSQLGMNPGFFAMGQYHRDQASFLLRAITAEIDTQGDGIGDIFVDMSTVSTLAT